MYRIHQFEKQEMIVVCKPEESHATGTTSCGATSVELFRNLEIPVRQLECCSGDLADLKVKSCDIEAWSPAPEEVFRGLLLLEPRRRAGAPTRASASRARTARCICRTPSTTPVVAPPRMLIAFLENHLQADGSVTIPEVLRPYMGGKEVLIPCKK